MAEPLLKGAESLSIYDATGRPYPGRGLPLSYSEHIRQQLELEIIGGGIEPGARVTEDELARHLGVSRTPVREAIRALESQGLIERRRGRGTSVTQRTSAAEAAALYDARAALEGELAAAAAGKITDDDLSTVTGLQRQFREVLAQGEPLERRRLVALDSDLHWTIYNATASNLTVILASYWGRLQRELYDPVYRSDPTVFADQHDAIITALRGRRADEARDAMVAHVRSGWDAIQASYGNPVESTSEATVVK